MKDKFIELSGWHFPEGIRKNVDLSDLNNESLEFYHDQLHVFWKKLEEGYFFPAHSKWTFRELFEKHRLVILEMLKRKIRHIYPINYLDQIPPKFNKEEIKESLLKKEKIKKNSKLIPKIGEKGDLIFEPTELSNKKKR